MTIQRIHHVQITIPSDAVDQARQFYLQQLGLTEIAKPASLQHRGGFWMQLGDMQIHVGIEDTIDRYQYKGHIAYQVNDLEVWRSKIRSYDLEILESIAIEGYERFEFRDPFGNRIEIIQTLSEIDDDQSSK